MVASRCSVSRAALVICLLVGVVLTYHFLRHLTEANEKRKLKAGVSIPPVVESMVKMFDVGGSEGRGEGLIMNDSINVVIASDKGRLGAMVALINSIYKNTKHRDKLKFYLVTEQGSTTYLRDWLKNNTRLRTLTYSIKTFNETWVKGKVKIRGGRMDLADPINYARFYIPSIFPELQGRYIYLDDDIIVQGDISELYATSIMPQHLVAFSEDCSSVSKRFNTFRNQYASYINMKNARVRELGLKPGACSFNAGVFVVASGRRWLQQNITAQLEHWMVLNTREDVYGSKAGGGGSQPPLMIVFASAYSSIAPLWHVRQLGWRSGANYSRPFLARAKLLHWNGHFKPWADAATPYSDLWRRYYVRDPTGKWRPSGKKRKGKDKGRNL